MSAPAAQKRKPLRVCLDARFANPPSGNDVVVLALAHALTRLGDGDEEYLFYAPASAAEQLRPHLGPAGGVVEIPRPAPGPEWRRVARQVPGLKRAWRGLRSAAKNDLPESDGVVESSGAEMMHLTLQQAFLTSLPTMYAPHDLLHLHWPQYLGREERRLRDVRYRTYCEQAQVVQVMTRWGKEDLLRNFGLAPEKVCVIPWASVLGAYPEPVEAELRATRSRLQLPEKFVFFPGYTWEHKNHIGLVRALAFLRDRGQIVPLVCSGHRTEFAETIDEEIRARGLQSQVRFAGYVSAMELKCLYRLARALVFPSKFEGWGLPISEAFDAGIPVACSRVRPLSDLAGTAALSFDPEQPEEIAEAVLRLWTDCNLRAALIEAGRKRAAQFSWERTARMFRAQYRRMAGRPVSDADRELIHAAPLV